MDRASNFKESNSTQMNFILFYTHSILYSTDLHLSNEVPDSIEQMTASSDDWNTTASMMDLAKRRSQRSHKVQSAETALSNTNQSRDEDSHNFGKFYFSQLCIPLYMCKIILVNIPRI